MGSLHPTTDGDCFVTFSTNMDIIQFETSKTVLDHDCLTKRRWKLGRIIRDDKHSDLGRASADYSLARARSRSIYGRFCYAEPRGSDRDATSSVIAYRMSQNKNQSRNLFANLHNLVM